MKKKKSIGLKNTTKSHYFHSFAFKNIVLLLWENTDSFIDTKKEMDFLFFYKNPMCWHFPSWTRIKTAAVRKLSVFYSSKNWNCFEEGVERGHSFMLHFFCDQYSAGCVLFWIFFGDFLSQLEDGLTDPVCQAHSHCWHTCQGSREQCMGGTDRPYQRIKYNIKP